MTGLTLVFVLVGVACVRDNPAEPGVRALSTDLQYKAIREKSAAPPNTVPAPLTEDDLPTLPPLPASGIGPVAPPVEVCPTASPSEHPDEDVPTQVTRNAEPGRYLWKVDGSQKVDQNRLDFGRFHNRSIENLEGEVSGGEVNITFETVERELSQSDPNPPFVRSFFEVNGDGVFLTRIEQEVEGGEMQTFAPLDPILYLPTPVIIGPDDDWESQGIDLLSEGQPQMLTHTAFVKGRMTIDSCGERVRAWLVVAKQTFSSGDATITRRYNYGIATHRGGIITFEHVETPCDEDDPKECDPKPDIEFDASLGKRLASEE